MVDLFGDYRHKVDAKGRLSLPSKFRKAFAQAFSSEDDDAAVELVVTIDPMEECLYAFEPDSFNSWVDKFFEKDGGYSNSNLKHVKIRRALKARAQCVEIDGAGRINLSAKQREAVGIGKEVALIGNRGYFEIWDAARWDENSAEVDLASLLYDTLA